MTIYTVTVTTARNEKLALQFDCYETASTFRGEIASNIRHFRQEKREYHIKDVSFDEPCGTTVCASTSQAHAIACQFAGVRQ